MSEGRRVAARDCWPVELARERCAPCRRLDAATCAVEVWELQRRATLFHTEWLPPFLPHDMEKQWRWVDSAYEKHAWTAVQRRRAAQQSETPPVAPPDGWPAGSSEWAVADPPGPCDGGRWQYAVDFYVTDALWAESPTMYHCRRRLWRRTIPSAAAAAPQALAPAAPARAPTAPAEEPRRAASSAPELRETVREEVPGISLAREAERLLAPEWTVGCLPVDVLLEATGAVEVEAGPWLRAPGPGGDRGGRTASREIMSRIPLPKGGPMMPTTTRSKDAYSVEVCGEGAEVASICIDITIDLLDVPYGDCFLIKERILLEATTDGTGVVVSKAYALKFRKRTLVQGVIEMNSVGSQEKSGAALVAFLQRRGAPATPAPQATIVEAWELQRRVTLFHQTWEAPFLPHDGEKSCRWVDHHFRQHPWAQGITWVASALAGRPPLRPPGGWPEHSLGWSVAQAPSGPCDEDGWQYGFDFYTDPAVWGQPAELSHCRRRLWRCSLSQPPTPGRQVVSCPEEKQSAEAPGLGTIWMVLVALPLLLLPGLAAGRPGGALAGAGPEWTLRFPGGGAEQAEEVRVKAHCLKEMGACEVMNCTAEGEGRGAKMDLAWAADVVGS